MSNHTANNRILLALLGLVLLGGGLLVLAGGADIYRRWNLSPPGSWPLTTPRNALIPRADQTRWTDQGWWWPTVIAALALLILLALTWLPAQSRRRRPRPLSVGERAQQAMTVSHTVLGNALTDDLDTLTGVRPGRLAVRSVSENWFRCPIGFLVAPRRNRDRAKPPSQPAPPVTLRRVQPMLRPKRARAGPRTVRPPGLNRA